MRKLIALLALVASGCTYTANIPVAPALNVYTSYEDKVPGNWVLVPDSGLTIGEREIVPSTFMCSAHKFKLNIGASLTESVRRSMEQVFENVEVRDQPPTFDAMKLQKVSGIILVKLDTFSPRVSFSPGFFSGTADATTDISLGVIVTGQEGRLLGTSVGASRNATGDAGGTCDGGATVMARSVELTTRDVLERLSERISNASKLREIKR